MDKQWRVGMKVGRTIYEQQGDEPSESDPLIGVMDTPELAAEAVAALNAARGQGTASERTSSTSSRSAGYRKADVDRWDLASPGVWRVDA